MASILGTWTIRTVTENTPLNTPFQRGTVVEITRDAITQEAIVKFGVTELRGSHDTGRNRVTVNPSLDEHWEFAASETREIGDPPEKFFVMYGCSWKMTKPDAMGSWVSDPQGTP